MPTVSICEIRMNLRVSIRLNIHSMYHMDAWVYIQLKHEKSGASGETNGGEKYAGSKNISMGGVGAEYGQPRTKLHWWHICVNGIGFACQEDVET
jgi:hypothetical protein